MMNQCLSIVLRNQFNLFYRFGYTVIPKVSLLEFNGIITDDTTNELVKLFNTATPFEYDEEYLILQLERSISENDVFVKFDIQDLVKIYPLSNQAKVSIESKIDQRIRLEKPIFEKILPKIESEIEKKEVEKAISALWAICKFERPEDKYLSDIGIENIFKGIEHRKKGTKANKIQDGSYWEYLIAYDRFDYFPNSTLGYFYDSGQVFAYSKQLPSFEGSTLHKVLEHINATNPSIKLPEIITFLESEKGLKGYVSQTTFNDTRNYIIAPLYLMLRNEIRNSDDVTQTKLFKNLEYLKTFEDNFYYSVILLGAFFGFRKFYDPYYETLNLRFYKSSTEPTRRLRTEESKDPSTSSLEMRELSKTPVEGENPKEENPNSTSEEQVEEHKEPSTSILAVKELLAKAVEDEISEKVNLSSSPSIESNNREATIEEDSKEPEPLVHINEFESDNLIQYRIIIEEAFTTQTKIKLKDLATLIKSRTGQPVSNTVIKNVINRIEGIEIISTKKNQPEAARKIETMGKLFND